VGEVDVDGCASVGNLSTWSLFVSFSLSSLILSLSLTPSVSVTLSVCLFCIALPLFSSLISLASVPRAGWVRKGEGVKGKGVV